MPEVLKPHHLIRMLSIALIEIRAIEKLEAAQALADIFHNVPSSLENAGDPEQIFRRMRECAKRYKLTQYLDSLRENVMKDDR